MQFSTNKTGTGIQIGVTVATPQSFYWTSPRQGGQLIAALNRTLMQYGNMLQKQAIQNASGRTVEFEGQNFRIRRITGNLVRNVHPPVQGPLSATVISDAAYAAAIEDGHKEIDLKKTMAGKVVPLPISVRAGQAAQTFMQNMGMKAYQTTDSKGGIITTVDGLRMSSLYASTGRRNGMQAVLFRYVPATGKGWIIPAAKPRPFMKAAAVTIAPKLEKAVSDVFVKTLGLE